MRSVRRSVAAPVVALALVALVGAACGGGSSADSTPTPTTTGTPLGTLKGRPSSPAVLRIVEPKNGEVVHGTSTQLVMTLQHAEVVPATTTHIVGTQGHVHVILDNQLVSMTYGLHQTLSDLKPGTHLLRAQFVASDHAPFNPPVFANAVTFTVKP